MVIQSNLSKATTIGGKKSSLNRDAPSIQVVYGTGLSDNSEPVLTATYIKGSPVLKDQLYFDGWLIMTPRKLSLDCNTVLRNHLFKTKYRCNNGGVLKPLA